MTEHEFACTKAKETGRYIQEERIKGYSVSEKNGDFRDIVTNIDERASESLIEGIHAAYPNDAVYSEEGGGIKKGKRMWVVDPIDGTSNFSRGIPHYAVSVGLIENETVMCGAVYDPSTDELFSFEKGGGAFLNSAPIHVSSLTDLSQAQVMVGFGSRKPELWDWAASSYRTLLERTWKRGMYGVSALDICYVAAGRADAAVYGTLSTLDIAAAIGILIEAGGTILNKEGLCIALRKDSQKAYIGNSEAIASELRVLLESEN